jgi:CAAX protease family protein
VIAPVALQPPAAPPGATPSHRPAAFLFVALVLPLYAVLGGLAQGASPSLGLVVSQLVLLVLPAAMAPLGCGYRAREALLLARRPAARAVALGAALGVAAFFAAGALMALTSLVFPARWVEAFDLPRKILELPARERLGVWIAAATIAPVCEELCFRGWVLTALRARRSTRAALALSGLLFAVVHLDPIRFSAVFALGTLYAWLAWRAGSLWPAVAAHVANNALGATLAALAGGGELASGRASSPTGFLSFARALELAASAAAVLAVCCGLVWALAQAYRRVTPEPLPVEAALVPLDPAAAPSRFRWPRVPRAWRVAFLSGVVVLWGMAWGDAMRRDGRRGASGIAPPGTAGSPDDRGAGAAPRRAEDRPAP